MKELAAKELSGYLTERIEQALNGVQFSAREPEVDLRDHWFTIVKHFRLIAALFVGVVLLTALVVILRYLLSTPPRLR